MGSDAYTTSTERRQRTSDLQNAQETLHLRGKNTREKKKKERGKGIRRAAAALKGSRETGKERSPWEATCLTPQRKMQQLDRGRQSREGAARTSAPPRGGGGHPSVRRSGGGWALRCRLWRSVLARGPAVAVWGQPEGRGGRLGQREEQGATAGEGGAGPPWESLALRMRRLSTCAPVRRYNLLQRLGTPEVGGPPPLPWNRLS